MRFLTLGFALAYFLVIDLWSIQGIGNDDIIWFRYLNYLGFYLPFLNLILLLVLVYKIKNNIMRWVFVSICLPGVVIPWLAVDLMYPKYENLKGGSETLEFSYVSYSKMSSNKNTDRLADILNCKKYDIISIQEAYFLEELDKQFWSESGCNVLINDSGSFALLSHYEVEIESQKKNYYSIYDVELSSGSHLKIINTRLDKGFDERRFRWKKDEVEELYAVVEGYDGAAILSGDFNDTIFNESVRVIGSVMKYARTNECFISGFTFPGEGRRIGLFGPAFGIDHVFYNQLELMSADVLGDSYGSDHYPIKAEFLFDKDLNDG